jgi:hypothetical protein
MTTRYDTALTRIVDHFRDSPNILAYLKAVFNRLDECDQLLSALSLERWIDTSYGVWLDYCGKLVGVWPRPPEYVDDGLVFTCKDIGEPDDANKGFSDTSQTFGGFLSDIDGLQTEVPVDDEVYRLYIKAKAYSTTSEAAERNVVMFCRDIFGIDVDVTTPQQYLMIATPTAPVDTQTRRIIEQLAPVVSAVRFRVEIV